MDSKFMTRLGRMVLLLIIQLLILNHIHLFGYATPLVIGYMIICFESGTSRMSLLWWGFVMGFIYDMFSNTMGMGMFSCTLLAMVKPYLLKSFIPRDVVDTFKPTIRNLTLSRYLWYSVSCMAVLHVSFYFLEAFTVNDIGMTILAMLVGTILATLLTVCIEYMVHSKELDRDTTK